MRSDSEVILLRSYPYANEILLPFIMRIIPQTLRLPIYNGSNVPDFGRSQIRAWPLLMKGDPAYRTGTLNFFYRDIRP